MCGRGVCPYYLSLAFSLFACLLPWLICLTWGHVLDVDMLVARHAHLAALELYLVVVLLINICTSVKISLRRCAYI